MLQIAELIGTSYATAKRLVSKREREIGRKLLPDDLRHLLWEVEEARRNKLLDQLLNAELFLR